VKSIEETIKKLAGRFPGVPFSASWFRDNCRVHVPATIIAEVLSYLKHDCGFDFLADLTAVDYADYPDSRDRFAVIYCLTATETGDRFVVKVFVNDPDPVLPSAVPLWNGANWLEREVFDMFGIRFAGHPDLRRILMPDEFTAFPLRKDYPLRGRGERHNFPVLTRDEG